MISGAGAAGVACAGISDVTVLDSHGILHPGRDDMNKGTADLAQRTNPAGRTGGMVEALDGADVFLDDLAPDRIVPSSLDPRVGPAVAAAVATVSQTAG